MNVEFGHTHTCVYRGQRATFGGWFFPLTCLKAASLLFLSLDGSSRIAGLRPSNGLSCLCLPSHHVSRVLDCRFTPLYPAF